MIVGDSMRPAGYMAKHVSSRPDWLKADRVTDIYSVSNCVSDDFADYINFWKHNGYWFFDSPGIILGLARDNNLDLKHSRLYYEVHGLEFNDMRCRWEPFTPERSFKTHVAEPEIKHLEGYDVVTYSVHTTAECSPLSCNSIAAEVETNKHCLLPSFATAKKLLEKGMFKNTEPGPYRIIAVYSVQWP